MNANQNRRKSHYVDKTVQGAIVVRILLHWALFLFAICGLLFFIELVTGNHQTTGKNMLMPYAPTLLSLVILTPILIRDLCKLTNRFAGPIMSLRRAIRDLAEGREVKPIKFRENDFWQDLADDFNQMLARIDSQKEAPASGETGLQGDANNGS